MTTEVGNYYIFLNEEDFYKKVSEHIKNDYRWINGGDYFPKIKKDDYPIVLNCSQKSMMFGIFKDEYFSDPKFVKLYNIELQKVRKKKLEKLIEDENYDTIPM